MQRRSKPVPTAEDMDAKTRNRLATVESLLLERQAKLDSTHLLLSKEIDALGKSDLEHIVDTARKQQAQDVMEKLEKDTKAALQTFVDDSKDFKAMCEKPSEKIGAANLLDLTAIDRFANKSTMYTALSSAKELRSPLSASA